MAILVSIAVGEGDLLDLPCKRRAGERYDLVIVKFQVPATQHRHVNAAATEPLTEDAHDAGMHSNNIRWSAVGGTRWGRGTHSQYLQSNVVPANDVIVLP